MRWMIGEIAIENSLTARPHPSPPPEYRRRGQGRGFSVRIIAWWFVFLAGGSTALATTPSPISVAGVTQNSDGITIQMNPGVMRVTVWSDRVIRVQYTDQNQLPADASLAVIGRPEAAEWKYSETKDAEIVSTDRVVAKVNRHNGAVGFYYPDGRRAYLDQASTDPMGLHHTLPSSDQPHGVVQEFKLRGEEAIYGLGQHQGGVMNYSGSMVHLQQVNMDVAVPMLLSSNGYGLLWDNPSVTDVCVSMSALRDGLSFASEEGKQIDYYFMAGPELDDVIASYRQLTGPAPMMGRWAWGFWQCKEHYKTQQELLDVVARYRQMQVPIDGIIQDWQYWPKGQWGSHDFDAARYPDPAAAVAQIHAEHCHILISVWARFEAATENYKTLEQANALYSTAVYNAYMGTWAKWYDAFNPVGRQLYWSFISKKLLPLGFDGWWLDATEPELGEHWGEFRDYMTAAGPGADVYNAYPLMHTTGVYQGQRADAPGKRVFILTRSAYTGQQRNSAVTWSGDIRGTWDVLRREIPAGLNFSASGIPYWNTDIGGFFGGKVSDPNYRELFARWFQFGAFCPMFRVHGTGDSKEMWKFDRDTENILIQYDQLRYRLLPYIYSVSWMVTNHGYTMMRPLVMDFRTDTEVLSIPDQYMFGPSLMINPVTQAHATARSVYLPGKGSWYDFWTGQKYAGGAPVIAAAPIQTLPIFVRAGAILPMGEVVQYAEQDPQGPLEIRLYRGANGSFELYDDEGDNYDYEKGAYATIPLKWDDTRGVLTIGQRTGDYPGMVKNREFRIVWVGTGRGAGLAEDTAHEQIVHYDGREMSVTAP